MSVNIERANDIKGHVWGSEAYPLEMPFSKKYSRPWSKLQSAWNILLKLKSHPGAVVGGIVILAYVICAVFAPYIAPYSPDEVALTERFVAPTLAGMHPFGTDQLWKGHTFQGYIRCSCLHPRRSLNHSNFHGGRRRAGTHSGLLSRCL